VLAKDGTASCNTESYSDRGKKELSALGEFLHYAEISALHQVNSFISLITFAFIHQSLTHCQIGVDPAFNDEPETDKHSKVTNFTVNELSSLVQSRQI
jgi:hypothetical protein